MVHLDVRIPQAVTIRASNLVENAGLGFVSVWDAAWIENDHRASAQVFKVEEELAEVYQ